MKEDLSQYEEMLERADKSLDTASTNLTLLKKVLAQIRDDNVIIKDAFLKVVEKAIPKLNEYFMEQVVAGAMRSGEYAYGPYLQQLVKAAKNVTITPSLDKTNRFIIKVDTSKFGHIDEWATAVKATRRQLEAESNSKFKNKKARKFNIDLASHMWKEKIYRPAREGSTYSKRIYDRKTRSYSEATLGDTGKYDRTIELRLANLPDSSHAPFWYLLEHGNTNVKTLSAGGTPYPVVQPQRIVEKFTRVAKSMLDAMIAEQMSISEREFFTEIEKGTGLKFTTTLRTLLKDYESQVTLVINSLGDIKKVDINGTIAKITTANKTYEIVRTSRGFGARYLFGSKR